MYYPVSKKTCFMWWIWRKGQNIRIIYTSTLRQQRSPFSPTFYFHIGFNMLMLNFTINCQEDGPKAFDAFAWNMSSINVPIHFLSFCAFENMDLRMDEERNNSCYALCIVIHLLSTWSLRPSDSRTKDAHAYKTTQFCLNRMHVANLRYSRLHMSIDV